MDFSRSSWKSGHQKSARFGVIAALQSLRYRPAITTLSGPLSLPQSSLRQKALQPSSFTKPMSKTLFDKMPLEGHTKANNHSHL
jgi:hypothetical protein